MSRSYKHSPIYTDRPNGAKWWKRQANRKVRYSSDILNGKGYRKFYNSWNIHDYISYESKADAIVWYNKITAENCPYNHYKEWILKDYPTVKDYLNKCWAHDYHHK